MKPTVGQKLRTLRQNRGMTQAALARYLHVSRQTVSSWETGRNQPDLATIADLAAFYQVPTDAILGSATASTESFPVTKFAVLSTLTVLIVERLTQLSSTGGLLWIDFLIIWSAALCWGVVHRRQPTTPERFNLNPLVSLYLFSIIAIVSGGLNLFDLGFGLATTCVFSGLIMLLSGLLTWFHEQHGRNLRG